MTRTVAAAALLLLLVGPSAAQEPIAPPAGRTIPDLQVAPPPMPRAEPARKAATTKEKKPLPRAAVLEEVAGVLRSVSPAESKLTIGTASGDVTLAYDRNTMVYTGAGLGTVRDLVPGVQARAGRNADLLAYWVQVRPAAPAGAPSSTPGQGTGPGGGGPGPTEGAGGAAGPGAPGGGNVGPGSIGPSTTQGTGGPPGATGGK